MSESFHFPMLSSERLILKQPTRADADAVFRIFSDPKVLRFYNVDLMGKREEAVALIESRRRRYELGYGLRWGIFLRISGEYIGSCGFEVWHKPWRFSEIGYELAQEHWRQGYMTEALRMMLAHGFDHMHLHRIEAQVEPLNEPSRKVLLKLGFREEGIARERGFWRQEFHDLTQFALLAPEFVR